MEWPGNPEWIQAASRAEMNAAMAVVAQLLRSVPWPAPSSSRAAPAVDLMAAALVRSASDSEKDEVINALLWFRGAWLLDDGRQDAAMVASIVWSVLAEVGAARWRCACHQRCTCHSP